MGIQIQIIIHVVVCRKLGLQCGAVRRENHAGNIRNLINQDRTETSQSPCAGKYT